jgi:predicted nucleic acid-binding protein
MKTYWDSSALVLALHDPSVRSRIKPGESLTRPHALAEIFSTLTKGINFRYSPDDAANMVHDLAEDLEFVELSSKETLSAVQSAGKHGVRGARIHDLMHAIAAIKGKSAVLVTLDQSGFTGLKLDLEIQTP